MKRRDMRVEHTFGAHLALILPFRCRHLQRHDRPLLASDTIQFRVRGTGDEVESSACLGASATFVTRARR